MPKMTHKLLKICTPKNWPLFCCTCLSPSWKLGKKKKNHTRAVNFVNCKLVLSLIHMRRQQSYQHFLQHLSWGNHLSLFLYQHHTVYMLWMKIWLPPQAWQLLECVVLWSLVLQISVSMIDQKKHISLS